MDREDSFYILCTGLTWRSSPSIIYIGKNRMRSLLRSLRSQWTPCLHIYTGSAHLQLFGKSSCIGLGVNTAELALNHTVEQVRLGIVIYTRSLLIIKKGSAIQAPVDTVERSYCVLEVERVDTVERSYCVLAAERVDRAYCVLAVERVDRPSNQIEVSMPLRESFERCQTASRCTHSPWTSHLGT